MLSDYFFCGVVAGGAMLGVGLIARSLPGASDADASVRSLAVLMAAYATGLGVIAIVIGLMATLVVTGDSGGLPAAAVMIVPAATLGVPGLLLCRSHERNGVHELTTILVSFGAGLGVMVVVASIIAVTLEAGDGASGLDPVVLALGIVAAVVVVGIGHVGAKGVQRLGGEQSPGEPIDAEVIRSGTIQRAAMLEGIGVLTLVAVMLLMVTNGA